MIKKGVPPPLLIPNGLVDRVLGHEFKCPVSPEIVG